VLAIVLPLYLLAMVSTDQINVDAVPAALPAWHLVQSGTVDLTGVDTDNPFVQPTEAGRRMSDRPLVLSLVAVPAYALTGDRAFSPDPSTVTASLLAVAAVVCLLFVLRRCVPESWAVGGALAFALGTATWPISAGQLWPHAPGQLFAALLLLALSAQPSRPWAGGVAAAGGVLVRPVTAVVPVVLAIGAGLRRQLREAIALLLPTLVALAVVALYNRWAFGSLTITGGFNNPVFRDNLTNQSPLGFVRNVAAAGFSPANGLFVWSPIVILALLGLPRAWTTTPPWARRAAAAGLVYLLVHLRLNRASGGLPLDYRYPLEPLMLAAPALIIGGRAFLTGQEWRRRVVVVALTASVLLQGAMALTYECTKVPGDDAQCAVLGL
jgi:hypothetical protein